MTIKRQLLTINQRSVDVRIGAGALDELSSLVGGVVGKPRRALVVVRDDLSADVLQKAERGLIDAGFSVERARFAAGEDVRALACAERLLEGLAASGITEDDLVLALGDTALCSLAAFCAKIWCGGCACALVPTGFDGMVTLATEMAPLGDGALAGMVSLPPQPSMVVCDLAFLPGMDTDLRRAGYVRMVGAALSDGKRFWEALTERAGELVSDDADALTDLLLSTMIARRNIVKAANPAARRALAYGTVTASALRACLGRDVPDYALLAEGMRFEARLAVDACRLDPKVVFAEDDLLWDLGIEDLGFGLDACRLVDAIRAEQARRSNRTMLALPRQVGSIRLAAVDDELLLRHAEAYCASRAELLSE